MVHPANEEVTLSTPGLPTDFLFNEEDVKSPNLSFESPKNFRQFYYVEVEYVFLNH